MACNRESPHAMESESTSTTKKGDTSEHDLSKYSDAWQHALTNVDKYNRTLVALRHQLGQPSTVFLLTFVTCFITTWASLVAPLLCCTLLALVPPLLWVAYRVPLATAIVDAPVLTAVREALSQGRVLDIRALCTEPENEKLRSCEDAVAIVNGLYLETIMADVVAKND